MPPLLRAKLASGLTSRSRVFHRGQVSSSSLISSNEGAAVASAGAAADMGSRAVTAVKQRDGLLLPRSYMLQTSLPSTARFMGSLQAHDVGKVNFLSHRLKKLASG